MTTDSVEPTTQAQQLAAPAQPQENVGEQHAAEGGGTGTTGNELLQAALEYAARGWHVLPLEPTGKRPHPRLAPKGFHSATTDSSIMRRWWHEAPDANVGIVTGATSGLIVVDVDGPEGEATLANLITGHELPAAPIVRTGRGRHIYFRHPGGTVKPRVLGPKLDLKADSGYVVAPPSVHASGAVYAWEATDAS